LLALDADLVLKRNFAGADLQPKHKEKDKEQNTRQKEWEDFFS